MAPDRRRIARLARLEKVRAIARQTAAAEAAAAEGTLGQLLALADRTAALARDYAGRSDCGDGHALAQLTAFSASLQQMAANTTGDAEAARSRADAAQLALAEAERRRTVVEDRVRTAMRSLALGRAHDPAGARKAVGTGLETDPA